MSRDAIEEIRAMIDLVRSVEAQRLRSAIGDSFADDVAQKMAINRAVFASGYGIDPRPYATPPQPAAAAPAASTAAAPAAAKSLAAKVAPWIVGIGLLGSGVGGSALWQWITTPPPAAAESAPETPRFQFGLLPPAK